MNNGNIELIENAFENIENINSSSPSGIIKAIDSNDRRYRYWKFEGCRKNQ